MQRDGDGTLIFIWRRPYQAPQEAIGLFTLREASDVMNLPATMIRSHLERFGYMNTATLHAELDE